MQVKTPFVHHVPTDLVENLKWRQAIHQRALNNPLYADTIWQACKQDPVFYINGFAWTYDPRAEPFRRIPMILYPSYQVDGLKEIIAAINSHDLFIEKSRDMGVSWLCLLAFEWAWHFYDLMSFLLISRNEDCVDKADNPKALFWKIDFFHQYLPRWLMPPGYDSSCRSKLHMHNPFTGSVIDGESTTGSAARGDRRSGILLDEFADVAEGYRVLRSTRDATKCRIFNSTPQGTGNAYYAVRQTNIKKQRYHWSQHPYKSLGLYTTDNDGKLKILRKEGYPENYKPTLDGRLRSPAYDYEWDRSSQREMAQEWDIDYGGSAYQYFSANIIQEAITKYARPPVIIGDLEYYSDNAQPVRFREDESGRLSLWYPLNKEGRLSLEHRIVLGMDVSAGTGSSNSCVCGYDATTYEKILEYANPYIRPEEFARQVVAIARWLNNKNENFLSRNQLAPLGTYLIWESNGPGRQFGSRVIELGYANIHYRRREEAISKKATNVPGWAATKETKLVLIGDYRAAIERFVCINRSKLALEETLEYIFDNVGGVAHSRESNKVDPTGARDNHGDRVIADALAWRGINERKHVPEPKKCEPPVGCLAWRMKQREKEKPKPGRELLVCEGWG